jgi:hypothetical protein
MEGRFKCGAGPCILGFLSKAFLTDSQGHLPGQWANFRVWNPGSSKAAPYSHPPKIKQEFTVILIKMWGVLLLLFGSIRV